MWSSSNKRPGPSVSPARRVSQAVLAPCCKQSRFGSCHSHTMVRWENKTSACRETGCTQLSSVSQKVARSRALAFGRKYLPGPGAARVARRARCGQHFVSVPSAFKVRPSCDDRKTWIYFLLQRCAARCAGVVALQRAFGGRGVHCEQVALGWQMEWQAGSLAVADAAQRREIACPGSPGVCKPAPVPFVSALSARTQAQRPTDSPLSLRDSSPAASPSFQAAT